MCPAVAYRREPGPLPPWWSDPARRHGRCQPRHHPARRPGPHRPPPPPAHRTSVSLTFGEPVVVAADGVRVFEPDGAEVDNGHAAALGRSTTVGVGLVRGDRQPQGTFTVSWRVISADSHPVAG